MITGLMRVRNEELILEDSLRHFLSYVPSLVVYDDASTDRTVEILHSFPNVTVIQGYEHQPKNESAHRELARRRIKTPYTLVFDADERLVGPLPTPTADGYRFRLYDAYMTPDMQRPYTAGLLADLPRMYGPEYRDIMMLWRTDRFSYVGALQREPWSPLACVEQSTVEVKHFGKALSTDHWEQNCTYYSTWPEPYASKWKARMGKAIHTRSDWDGELYSWDDVRKQGIKLLY